MWIHLWRPPRNIYGVKMAPLDKGYDFIYCFLGHFFLAARTSFKMAVSARLVAEQADIDLLGSGLAAIQRKSVA